MSHAFTNTVPGAQLGFLQYLQAREQRGKRANRGCVRVAERRTLGCHGRCGPCPGSRRAGSVSSAQDDAPGRRQAGVALRLSPPLSTAPRLGSTCPFLALSPKPPSTVLPWPNALLTVYNYGPHINGISRPLYAEYSTRRVSQQNTNPT